MRLCNMLHQKNVHRYYVCSNKQTCIKSDFPLYFKFITPHPIVIHHQQHHAKTQNKQHN